MGDNGAALVSIGVPTFNRAEGLRQALGDLLSQTYGHIEIIISDNASTDPAVGRMMDDVLASDSRVVCHHHERNLGPIANFAFTLGKASGTYFMWAADDDRREPWMVETLVRQLESNRDLALACVEAQYFDGERRFPAFAEGRPFYHKPPASPSRRAAQMLKHNYGNLVYGLFSTAVIREAIPYFGLNEVAFLVKVASLGGVRVAKQVGFYKQARAQVVAQAQWEMQGGKLPTRTAVLPSFPEAHSAARYHWHALQPALNCIASMRNVSPTGRRRLQGMACCTIGAHCGSLVIGWKPRSAL
jgi:hypothetical protein